MRASTGGLISILTLVLVAFFANNAASAVNHGEVVTETPRDDLPVVLDGSVFAHEQIGDRIYVGGNFSQVQRPDGTVINQPYIFAYDINTGLLDESFRPVLSNAVNALEANPADDALYVGGRFSAWNGASVGRIVKLAADGTLDTSFQGSASALVRSLAANDDTVFLAGDFTTVNGLAREGFAAVDAISGAVDPDFIMNVENTVVSPQLGRSVVVSDDGNSVFGLHYGTHINGNPREALVKVDVGGATPVLADWRIDLTAQIVGSGCHHRLRDLAISPDGSFIVIGGQGQDFAPNCSSVLQYPTSGTGVIAYNWSARFYSSIFSLAVSDTAVYVGGHFCGAPKNAAPPGGNTHTPTGATANLCNVNDPLDPINPSVIFPDDAVFRRQLAALDPANGQALPWDPGSNAGLGTLDLTVTDRGLLAGMDSDRYAGILTGRSGFFDIGAAVDPVDPVDPVVQAAESCSVVLNGNNQPQVSWADFASADNVQIRRNGAWLATGAPVSGFLDDATAAAGSTHSYEVRWRPNGSVVDVPCSPTSITVPTGADAAVADVTPPVLSLATALVQSPGVIDLDGAVTDDISGVDRVRVTVFNQQTGEYWNGTAWQGAWVWNLATLGADTWTLPNVDLTQSADYELQFWAWDNDGNRAGNDDNIKPAISVN